MADQFRNVFCIAVAHESKARFGIEHDIRLCAAIEAQSYDQVRVTVVAACDCSTDDDRTPSHFCFGRLVLQRGGSMNTMSLPSSTPEGRRRKMCRFQLLSFSSAAPASSFGITRSIN